LFHPLILHEQVVSSTQHISSAVRVMHSEVVSSSNSSVANGGFNIYLKSV